MANNNARIAKNTIFLYGRLIVTMLISLYTTRVVLNVLGVEDFGIYNVVCGFVALFSFINTTMSNGIQRFYNYEAGKNGIESVTSVFQTAFTIQIILILIILLIIEPVGIWYINHKMVIPIERLPAANWVFQFSLLSLALLVMQVPFSAAVMAHERMDYYASVGIIDAILKLGIVLILPYLKGDSLIIYGLLIFFVSVINLFLYSIYAIHNFKELKLSRIFHKDLFKSIFSFTGWNLVEMFAWTTQGQGVNMVMNLFCGPVANAAQGVASQISSALNSFCSNLSVAFRPQLVHSYAEGNFSRTTNMMFTMSKAMFILMSLMVIPLSLEMRYVLSIWLGDTIPEYTLEFSVLIIISMLPRNMTMALSQVVHASGKMKYYQIGSAVIIILSLPVSYILLKGGLSPVYIYVCNIVIFLVLWVADLFLLRKIYSYSIKQYFLLVAIPCIVTISISYIIPYFIHIMMNEGLLRLLAVVFSSVVVVSLNAFLLLLSKEDKKRVIQFISK